MSQSVGNANLSRNKRVSLTGEEGAASERTSSPRISIFSLTARYRGKKHDRPTTPASSPATAAQPRRHSDDTDSRPASPSATTLARPFSLPVYQGEGETLASARSASIASSLDEEETPVRMRGVPGRLRQMNLFSSRNRRTSSSSLEEVDALVTMRGVPGRRLQRAQAAGSSPRIEKVARGGGGGSDPITTPVRRFVHLNRPLVQVKSASSSSFVGRADSTAILDGLDIYQSQSMVDPALSGSSSGSELSYRKGSQQSAEGESGEELLCPAVPQPEYGSVLSGLDMTIVQDGRSVVLSRFVRSETPHLLMMRDCVRLYEAAFSHSSADGICWRIRISEMVVGNSKAYYMYESDLDCLLPLSILCDNLEAALKKVESRLTDWSVGVTVGGVFSKDIIPVVENYLQKDLKPAYIHLRKKVEDRPEAIDVCWVRSAPYSLKSLLYVPVERLWNYEKYIQELLLETQSVHPDFDELNRASARTSTMMKQLSEPQDVVHADVQNEYRLEKVQNLFPNDNLGLLGIYPQKAKTLQRRKTFAGKGYKNNFTLSLSPQMDIETRSVRSSLNNNTGRFYVMEGPVTLTSGVQVQDRHLFVFSDLLLIAKPNKSSTSYKLKHRVRVCELWFSDCLSIVCEATKHQETSFVIGWPTTNVVATFASPQLKNNWLAKLKELIAMGKEKEVPKTVVLKIYVSNSNNGAHYKSVTISNTETAAECVQKACNLFEINAVDAGNYQLWVTSGKEETYPLIGHEHPYSILMSLIRDSRHGDDLSSPLDLGQICVPDNQTHCQFRLVQRQKPTITDSPKKSKKRSPANLKSLFKRSGKLQESPSSDSSPAGTPTGKLFRHPLSDVCDAEGSLPKPIMELLRELFAQGPRTQGIFRRSANKRVCNELKQKLDTGEAVCMADISVLTSATVLKDFCRSMPYCLLMSNLYHEWAAAVEETDTAQKMCKFKTLLGKLPASHVELLRHFVCVLWHIDRRRADNQMNALNLGICVGVSLLWPPEGASMEIEADATQKGPLSLQFIIENCKELLGDDVTELFGEPVDRDGSLHDSDSTHSMRELTGQLARDNSSVDSLECELEIDTEGKEASPTNQTSPTNLSRDSGLTLSYQHLFDGEEDTEYREEEDTSKAKHAAHAAHGANGHDYLSKSLTSHGYGDATDHSCCGGTSVDSLLAGDGIDGGQLFTTHEMGTLLRSPSGGHLYYNDEAAEGATTPEKRLDNRRRAGKMFYLSAQPLRPAHHNKGRAPSPPPRRHRSGGASGGVLVKEKRSCSYDGVLTEPEQTPAAPPGGAARQSRSTASGGSMSRSKSEGGRVRMAHERSPSPQVPPRHKKHAKTPGSNDPPVYIPAPDYNVRAAGGDGGSGSGGGGGGGGGGCSAPDDPRRTRKPSNGSGGYFSAESDYSYDHSRSNSATSNDEARRNQRPYIHTIKIGGAADDVVYEVKSDDRLNSSYESNWQRVLDTPTSAASTPGPHGAPPVERKLQRPPTYEETMQRGSSSWIGGDDRILIRQKVKDMGAKLMYQDSLRQYQREHNAETAGAAAPQTPGAELVSERERPHSTSNMQIPDGTYRAVPVHRSNSDTKYRAHSQQRPYAATLSGRELQQRPRVAPAAKASTREPKKAAALASVAEVGEKPTHPGGRAAYYYGMEDESKGRTVAESATRPRSKERFFYGMEDERGAARGQEAAVTRSEYGGAATAGSSRPRRSGRDTYYYGMDAGSKNDVRMRAPPRAGAAARQRVFGMPHHQAPRSSVSDLRQTFEKPACSTRSEYVIAPYRPWQGRDDARYESQSDYRPPSDASAIYYTYTARQLRRKSGLRDSESYV